MTESRETSSNTNARVSKIIDDDKNTSLHHSAARGCEKDLLRDLEIEPKIDVENYLGWTPLMMACKRGHIHIVKLLLDRRADATRKNKFGMSVFLVSIASGNLDIVHLILQHLLCGGVSRQSMQKSFSPISLAILFCSQDITKYLIDQNFNVNIATPLTGITPLMFASAMDNSEAFTLLLSKGADASIKNYLGLTAHELSQFRHQKVETRQKETNRQQKTLPKSPPDVQSPQVPQPQLQLPPQHQLPPQTQISSQLVDQTRPQQVPYIVISPQPSFFQIHHPNHAMINPHIRKSSDAITPSPNFYYAATPNMTPIAPINCLPQPQMFFPPEFSPSQYYTASPVPNIYGSNDFLNARINQNNIYISPMQTMMNYASPCV